jgi:hypothetical protein
VLDASFVLHFLKLLQNILLFRACANFEVFRNCVDDYCGGTFHCLLLIHSRQVTESSLLEITCWVTYF